MSYKIAGACTSCDGPCFEIMGRYEPHERYPGEPKQLGMPLEGAMRIFFRLYDGSIMPLTFCGDCNPVHENYTSIWQKVLRSWVREGETMGPQFDNGILCELGRKSWTDMVNGDE